MVDLRIVQPVIAQHQCSTFRVLVRLMTDNHKRVFDGGAVEYSDSKLWETVLFDMDSRSWGVSSARVLERRFRWVLEYIRTGILSTEIVCFRDAFRQLASEEGGLLKSMKHPYNYDLGRTFERFFNPDLDPKWVRSLLTNETMDRLLKMLNDFYGIEITQRKIEYCYGILVADVWEEVFTCKGRGPFTDNILNMWWKFQRQSATTSKFGIVAALGRQSVTHSNAYLSS